MSQYFLHCNCKAKIQDKKLEVWLEGLVLNMNIERTDHCQCEANFSSDLQCGREE